MFYCLVLWAVLLDSLHSMYIVWIKLSCNTCTIAMRLNDQLVAWVRVTRNMAWNDLSLNIFMLKYFSNKSQTDVENFDVGLTFIAKIFLQVLRSVLWWLWKLHNEFIAIELKYSASFIIGYVVKPILHHVCVTCGFNAKRELITQIWQVPPLGSIRGHLQWANTQARCTQLYRRIIECPVYSL